MSVDLVKTCPKEIRVEIFDLLDMQDLCRCTRVCKDWNKFLNDETLWKKIALKITGAIPNELNIKAFVKKFVCQRLRSNEEILKRIEAFFSEVPIGQNAKLTCISQKDKKNMQLSVSITAKENDDSNDPDFFQSTKFTENLDCKEECYAINGLENGSLTTKPPRHTPKYQHKMIISSRDQTHKFIYRTNKGFGIGLYFPDFGNHMTAQLELGIVNAMQKKMDEFETHASRKKILKYGSIAAIALAGAYALGRFLKDE